ncbi:hypothetical protein CC78DRAFT_585528 [Lojkania enalia]|uniref:Uncharacterized protein n=1 Tax=Lojkania enalia TaxID=147567 RepID=A0A9P4K5G7_9PLEO|nr:hypothetical protein CC78DRAFT_585528 [Didymosphaeria enalia]
MAPRAIRKPRIKFERYQKTKNQGNIMSRTAMNGVDEAEQECLPVAKSLPKNHEISAGDLNAVLSKAGSLAPTVTTESTSLRSTSITVPSKRATPDFPFAVPVEDTSLVSTSITVPPKATSLDHTLIAAPTKTVSSAPASIAVPPETTPPISTETTRMPKSIPSVPYLAPKKSKRAHFMQSQSPVPTSTLTHHEGSAVEIDMPLRAPYRIPVVTTRASKHGHYVRSESSSPSKALFEGLQAAMCAQGSPEVLEGPLPTYPVPQRQSSALNEIKPDLCLALDSASSCAIRYTSPETDSSIHHASLMKNGKGHTQVEDTQSSKIAANTMKAHAAYLATPFCTDDTISITQIRGLWRTMPAFIVAPPTLRKSKKPECLLTRSLPQHGEQAAAATELIPSSQSTRPTNITNNGKFINQDWDSTASEPPVVCSVPINIRNPRGRQVPTSPDRIDELLSISVKPDIPIGDPSNLQQQFKRNGTGPNPTRSKHRRIPQNFSFRKRNVPHLRNPNPLFDPRIQVPSNLHPGMPAYWGWLQKHGYIDQNGQIFLPQENNGFVDIKPAKYHNLHGNAVVQKDTHYPTKITRGFQPASKPASASQPRPSSPPLCRPIIIQQGQDDPPSELQDKIPPYGTIPYYKFLKRSPIFRFNGEGLLLRSHMTDRLVLLFDNPSTAPSWASAIPGLQASRRDDGVREKMDGVQKQELYRETRIIKEDIKRGCKLAMRAADELRLEKEGELVRCMNHREVDVRLKAAVEGAAQFNIVIHIFQIHTSVCFPKH